MNEPQHTTNTKGLYANILLRKWWELIELSEKLRSFYLINEQDDMLCQQLLAEYIGKLTRFWGELRPKIENRREGRFKEISEEFMKYKHYYYDPAPLLEPEHLDEIFKIESIVREVLEALEIFNYEGIK